MNAAQDILVKRDEVGAKPVLGVKAWFQIALMLRVVKALTILVIENDTVRYVRQAEAIGEWTAEGWRRALAEDYHPLFSFLMALGGKVLGDFNAAGVIINIVLGALVVIPVYKLTELVYDSRAASYAAMFAAFTPLMVLLSGEATSDMSHLFFYMCGLYFLVLGMRKVRKREFLLSGIFIGLAYLSRPDVIALLASALMIVLFAVGTLSRIALKSRLVFASLLLAGFALVSAPYMSYLAGEGYLLSRKFPVFAYAGVVTPEEIAAPEDLPEDVIYPWNPGAFDARYAPDTGPLTKPPPWKAPLVVVNSMFISCLYAALVFLLLGIPINIVFPGRIPQRMPFWRIAAVLGFVSFCMFLAVLLKKGYVSERHTLVLVCALLPLAGCGVAAIDNYLCTMFGRSRLGMGWRAVLITIIIAVFLGKLISFERASKIEIVKAGEAIREELGTDAKTHRDVTLMSSQSCSRLPFYAGANLYSLQMPARPENASVGVLLANLEYYDIDFVVLDCDAYDAEFLQELTHALTSSGAKIIYETNVSDGAEFRIRILRTTR